MAHSTLRFLCYPQCPTVQGRDLDSDMSDSDNRTCFVRDWDLLMRGEAITGQDPLDSCVTSTLIFSDAAYQLVL